MLNQLREHGLAKVHASLSCLSENGRFSLNPIQIVFDRNRHNPCGNNGLQPELDFYPDSSDVKYIVTLICPTSLS